MSDERFISIAEELGEPAPAAPPSAQQQIEEAINAAVAVLRKCKSRKEFCQKFLATPLYIRSLLQRAALGDLAPAVETLFYHYADGKPVDKVEFKDTTNPIDSFTAEQCEERAKKLLELARQLREDEAPAEAAPKTQQQQHVH